MDEQSRYANFGTNQLLCADPQTGEVKRFLAGPRGCEITGITSTPDGTTMWVNIQHPTISYPASDGKTRPRSTTVVITKNDGGVIGT
jgi:secreted PhoX family phosphatase